MLEKIEIPIIEEAKGGKEGYWEIYKDKKIWKSMANPILIAFQDKKKTESSFITLAEDGEKVSGVVKAIKTLLKVGFKGQEIEVVRLELETENGLKSFDKGTKKWVDELVEKEVDVGSVITIIRHGKKESKDTWYEVIKNK